MMFQTDLGTMGMLICFDLKHSEVSASLARSGARDFLVVS